MLWSGCGRLRAGSGLIEFVEQVAWLDSVHLYPQVAVNDLCAVFEALFTAYAMEQDSEGGDGVDIPAWSELMLVAVEQVVVVAGPES